MPSMVSSSESASSKKISQQGSFRSYGNLYHVFWKYSYSSSTTVLTLSGSLTV